MSRFLDFLGGKVHYQVFGTGKTVCFLHGFCEDMTMWSDFLAPFTEYQIVLIDLPGFGQSDVIEDLTVEKMAQAVDAILRHETIEECTLIGHSMGGYVGLAFAAGFIEKLNGLTLFHSHPYADSDTKKVNRQKSINFLEKHGSRHFVQQLIPNLFSDEVVNKYEALIQEMVKKAKEYPVKGIIAATQAMMSRPDSSTLLEELDIPVQFIIGKKDNAVTWNQSIDAVPNLAISHVRIYDHVGHMGMFEAPKDTQEDIKSFLEYIHTNTTL